MRQKQWSERFKHVFSYKKKSGVAWGYRYPYYNSMGQRIEAFESGIVSEKKAYQKLVNVINEIENGNKSLLDSKNLLIKDWADTWVDFYQNTWSPNTLKNTQQALKQAILPMLGKMKYSELDKVKYKENFLKPLLKKYKPATVRLFHRRFMTMTNAAVEHDKLDKNRMTGIKIPQPEKEIKAFTKEELKKFNVELQNEEIISKALFTLILSTGLRLGEALGLTWIDVDLSRRMIDVNKSRGATGIGTTKTFSSNRKIVIDQNTKAILEELKFQTPFDKPIDYLFMNEYGNPYSPVNARYSFNRIIQAAGVRNITIHGLRHTHATFLLEADANIKYVSARLGHKKISTTLDTYTHILENKETETADLFGQIMDDL
ncbi:site-specific integrase [Enterococcus sp. BWM-S5]|uniref:Site-specific integrase n=1 Tax=Enterococcus larvae TaxID=2794352 RepID=A0ABS4CFW1_9ENTE|nr:site-specific integrase [Enterococcus larvae]MBP1044890.1 site-specific integrase [Enterococcus larvae]